MESDIDLGCLRHDIQGMGSSRMKLHLNRSELKKWVRC